jgi:hypothetical protein
MIDFLTMKQDSIVTNSASWQHHDRDLLAEVSYFICCRVGAPVLHTPCVGMSMYCVDTGTCGVAAGLGS